jgi:hypothetical protein
MDALFLKMSYKNGVIRDTDYIMSMDCNAKHTLVKVLINLLEILGQKQKMSGKKFIKWEWRFFITQNGIVYTISKQNSPIF